MRLFDAWLMADWSAANTPKLGKDSIWIAWSDADRATEILNIPTRAEATAFIRERISGAVAEGKSVCAGFDFAFGYPAGAAGLLTNQPGWRGLWAYLDACVQEGDRNSSNRFEVADSLNAELPGEGPFWGHPWQHKNRYAHLLAKKPSVFDPFKEWRHAERWNTTAKSVWQLCYNGAVGSQAILGIAALECLRKSLPCPVKVWPFETAFADNVATRGTVTLIEIYPSLFPVCRYEGEVLDAAQVRTVAEIFRALDQAGKLGAFLSAPEGLDEAAKVDILDDEGWIAGLGREDMLERL